MSSKTLKVIVNGKEYQVEIANLADSPVTVAVNGQPYTVDYSVVEQAAAGEASAPAPAMMAARVAASPQPAAAGANAVVAPMPGVIVEVLVKPGDQVANGQEVCTLEAMKMKNAIRTARSGVVATVPVSAGQKVAYGQALVTFE
jgi:biotin carboxyl carrier protein